MNLYKKALLNVSGMASRNDGLPLAHSGTSLRNTIFPVLVCPANRVLWLSRHPASIQEIIPKASAARPSPASASRGKDAV
jgi:hypothetical protein